MSPATPPTQPKQPRKPSTGTRSFERRQKRLRTRSSRRQSVRIRGQRPTSLWADALTLFRRLPAAAWICALIAVLNATAWSIITPPFQGRDEVDHFAYVVHLAQTGSPPTSELHAYSQQENLVLEGLHYGEVRFTPYLPSISTVAQQRALENDAAQKASREFPAAGGAAAEPPLFYALQTIPYSLGGSNMLTQLQLMRLFDALLGGLTALLVFMFLRETLPGVPWAATVGGICVALQPQFAYTTGSLNPDAAIFALSAGVFYCLARAFRRGLTVKLALAFGLTIAIGFMTYFSFIGVAAGACLGLLLLAVRGARATGRRGLIAPAVAFGLGMSPVAIDWLIKTFSHAAAFGSASVSGSNLTKQPVLNLISYVWQVYLPRLPGMPHYFEGLSTWREIWFDRSVGFYGWMDTMFPGWVQNVALILAIPTLLLCMRELIARRAAIRARLPELSSYAAITLGTLVIIGLSSYSSDIIEKELAYGEPRYLLPMIALLGAVLTLAVRGVGRRWMPIAGAAMVVLFLGHDVFSQLQVIARFYG